MDSSAEENNPNGGNHILQLTPYNAESREVLPKEIRPRLTITTDPPVYLGDNDSTGIVDQNLSHTVVKVYLKRNKIFAFPLPNTQGSAWVNNAPLIPGTRRQINVGDILGLTTSSDPSPKTMDYAYKVQRAEAPVAPSTAIAVQVPAGDSSTSIAPSASASFPPEVAEETMCAICMEIMFQPRTIVPCGHCFCERCIRGQVQCASCRGPIDGKAPCRNLENLISIFTSCKDIAIYDKGDLTCYTNRTSKKRSPAKMSKNNHKNAKVARRVLTRRTRQRTVPARSSGGNATNAILLE